MRERQFTWSHLTGVELVDIKTDGGHKNIFSLCRKSTRFWTGFVQIADLIHRSAR